jgi:putative ABC transport system permease protein
VIRRLAVNLGPRWRALTGSASAAAAALGLLACLCTLLAVVGPRSGAQLRTSAYRGFIAAAPALSKAVIGTIDYSALSGPRGLSARLVAATSTTLRQRLATLPLAPSRADWSSVTTTALGLNDDAPGAQAFLPPRVELSYRNTLAKNVRVIAGRLPAGEPGNGTAALVQVAVTPRTARQFGLAVGTQVAVPSADIVLRVTAIVQPKDPTSPFWTSDPTLEAPEFVEVTLDAGYYLAGVFIAPGALPALLGRVNTGTTEVTLTYPLAIGQLTAAQATQLRSALVGTMSTAGYLTGVQRQLISIALSSDVVALITNFVAEAGAVGNVVDLLAVGLAVLAAVVVLLAGWLLAERRRQDFAVLRARGASRRQLVLAVLGGAAVAAVPGAAVGAGLAVALTPSAPVALSWWLAGLEVFAALAGPVLVTVRTHRGYAAPARPDAPLERVSSVRRWVVEVAVVAGAAGGLLVLRDQGSAAAGDVYASAAPVLLAIGVAVIVLRVYPPLVRGVLRLRGQRASAVTFLGLARAARASAAAALPAFALVLALALVSFAGMVRGAVIGGQVSASWQQAGADAVISEPGTVSQALQRAVAAVPGVRQLVPAGVASVGVTGGGQLDLLAVNPAQYAALVAGSPLPQPPATFTASAKGTVVPVLAAPGLSADLGNGSFGVLIAGYYIQARVVGQAASMSALPYVSNGYLVLPRRALGNAAPPPSTLLVRGSHLNQAALRAAVARYAPGASVVFRSQLAAALEDEPLQHGAVIAMTLGGAAAGVCGLLVLLLSLLLSASARRLVLVRMSTMGLSGGQGRLLGVVELLPQLVAVVVGGLVCAVVLVPLVGPALSLGVFTGSGGSVAVVVEPAWLVVAGVGLVVLAVVTVAGQTVLTDRGAARSLRIGE